MNDKAKCALKREKGDAQPKLEKNKPEKREKNEHESIEQRFFAVIIMKRRKNGLKNIIGYIEA